MQLTDQGLTQLFAIMAIPIFGSFAFTFTVLIMLLSVRSRIDNLHWRVEQQESQASRFFDVLEANAIKRIVEANNPLNERQKSIARLVETDQTARYLTDSEMVELIQGLDHEKEWLERELKREENPRRTEQASRLDAVEKILATLNARYNNRVFAAEMERAAVVKREKKPLWKFW
jgi:hypothetical protein